MVSRLKKILLLVLTPLSLCFSVTTESAAYRAAEFYTKADYSKAHSYSIRALEASKVESDIIKQNSIYLNIATLYIQALRFSDADSILSLVHKDALSPVQDYYNLISIQVADGMGKCEESPVFESLLKAPNKTESFVFARAQLQLADCLITKNEFSKAESLIKRAEDVLPEGGQLSFAYGKLAFAKKDYESAKSHFIASLSAAQKKKKFYYIAVLLFHLGETYTASGDNLTALKFYTRSLEVFKKLRLKNWHNKVLTSITSIQ